MKSSKVVNSFLNKYLQMCICVALDIFNYDNFSFIQETDQSEVTVFGEITSIYLYKTTDLVSQQNLKYLHFLFGSPKVT